MQIFLNYRREETSGHAGRLYDALAARFAEDRVFMDIDRIEPGLDFTQVIDAAVSSCDALIAIIGSRWLTISDAKGRPRLEKPDDFVRLELRTALERGIRVIPALVQNAEMPGSDELPQDLRPLALRQGVELSDRRWAFDVGKLIQALERLETQLAAEEAAARAAAEKARAEQEEAERARAEQEAAELARAEREAAERAAAEKARAEREAEAREQAERERRARRRAEREEAALVAEPEPRARTAATRPERKPRVLRAELLSGRGGAALALLGAAALALGYFVDSGTPESPSGFVPGNGSQWHFALESLDPFYEAPLWFVWSPIEALGVALAVVAVVVADYRFGLSRDLSSGALIGLGLLSVAASLALLGNYSPILTCLGALAILGAGVLGAARHRPAGAQETPRWAAPAAGAGALLLFVSLFLDFASPGKGGPDKTGLGQLSELGYAYWLELVVAVVLALAAAGLVSRLPRFRLLAAGILIAVGVQTALHLSGVILQLAKWDRNLEHVWRFGGVVGLLGSALLLAAGSGVLRAGLALGRDRGQAASVPQT